ncbi:MAG: hypothetical protein WBV82_12030, partial [Myxococcaceae bacterium]
MSTEQWKRELISHPTAVVTREHSSSAFDLGLHANSELGPIELSLKVDGATAVVVVLAPMVGKLSALF